MKWSDLPIHPSSRILRQFAGAWLIFFLGSGALQHFSRGRPRLGLALAIMAVVVGGVGLLKPGAIRWLFVGCTVVAFPIGWVVSQVALLVMFYGLITPMALVMRLLGRDPLHRQPAASRLSCWLPKETPQDVRSYFRQY